MNNMAILNYSTVRSVDKSIAKITECLRKHGASAILTDFDQQGYIVAVSFKIALNGSCIGFRLPTDWRAVLEVMRAKKG